MAQGRLERVRIGFAGEVIATRTNKSRPEESTRLDLLFQVEIVLQRVWELRIVCRTEAVYRLCEESILGVEEAGKHEGLNAEKRR